MTEIKLHFWDDEKSHPERNSFRERIKKLGIKTSLNTADLGDIDLLFIHGSDSSKLAGYAFSKPVFKVSFGGNPTTVNPIFKQENRISYINANELANRFETIYSELEKTQNLTIERLYEITFGFDPQLEKLLEPFSSLNPFETNYQGTNLKDAKQELQMYIEKYLKEQS